jgi:putative ABC transport system permease protein
MLIESLRVALTAIWANKLRAVLTMLGVIIGVSSVIIMVAIVQGLRHKIVEQISSNGANLIFGFYAPKPDSVHRGGYDGIRMEDVDAINRECTLIGPVSPVHGTQIEARVGSFRKSVQLTGVLGSYALTQNVTLSRGRFIDADDDATYGKACVIGVKVRQELFPDDADPIGKELIASANGEMVSLVVVGLLDEKDRGPGGDDFNNSMFASLRSVQKRFTGSGRIDGFATRALDVTRTQDGADQIWAVLKKRHPLSYKDFIVDTQEGLLKQLDSAILTLQIVLGGIGGLSLLTGGIGIMNIMLVSVTERTREIGIRKAVGARSSAILVQFVVEAMVVAGLGGLIGIAQGYGIAWTIGHFAEKVLPTFVPFWAVGLGFGFSVGVGLFFGIYPAYRASRLDPIMALRYE